MPKPLYDRILFSEDQVDKRIAELADLVIEQYKDARPLFICLLRGGAPFSAKLMFEISAKDPYFQPELDYMTIRTYGDDLDAKKPEIVMDLSPTTEVKSRTVILLDDILDTGVTTNFVADLLTTRGASSVDLCVLVRKQKKQLPFNGKIIHGFATPPDWQTGMGLDDPRIGKEANRWASYIAKANK